MRNTNYETGTDEIVKTGESEERRKLKKKICTKYEHRATGKREIVQICT